MYSILKKWINKVIGIEHFSEQEGKAIRGAQYYLLLDTDSNGVYIKDFANTEFYLTFSAILIIYPPEKEGNEKFFDYSNKYKNNPDFKGDTEGKDKGYHVIKSKVE